MLNHALEYLARGWSVIPCTPKDKRPLVRWQEYQTRRPTEDEVRAWWTANPNASIAIVTGKISGLAVVDVDPGRGGTCDDLPPTVVVRTGGGGWHYYYRYPATGSVPSGVGADGIDVRGDGGYVIAPPSVHQSGDVYSWAKGGELSPCPARFLAGSKVKAETPTDDTDRWLSRIISGGIVGGGRNDTATKYAGYLAGKQVPLDVAKQLVTQWNRKLDNPLDSGELETTIESAYRTAKRNGGRAREDEDKPFTAMSFGDFTLKYGGESVKWLVPGWMPEATIAFLVAPPGSYKSWLMWDLAVSVATGKPMMGVTPERTGPVLVMQQEDAHGINAQRSNLVLYAKHGIIPPAMTEDSLMYEMPSGNIPIYVREERDFRFSDPKSMAGLEEWIEKHRPVLVCLDPLYSAASNEEYMAKDIDAMFKMKELRDKYGVTFCILHHTNKGAGDDVSRLDAWGSQFLNAFLETGWQIRKKSLDSTHVKLYRHFKLSQAPEPLKLAFHIEESSFRYEVETAVYSEATESEQPEDPIIKSLIELGSCTLSELANVMGANINKLRRDLNKLMADDMVVKIDNKYMYKALPAIT